MTDYLGFNILEKRSDASLEPSDTFTRSTVSFDPGPGKVKKTVADRAPKVTRSFLWTCRSLVEIAEMITWIKVRRGRLVPFWTPTWRTDLLLSVPPQNGDFTITAVNSGYARYAFQHKARRHFAICLPSSVLYRHASDSSDLGVTETVTFTASVPIIPVETMISNLVLCRLNIDTIEITHISNSMAQATLQYIEIPEETP